ncbi:MAG: DUF1460 domain-containing protein [Chitinophagales bacterium]|nr:DUF1460 domain-containing protein [Chitinophagales bacterium]
MGLTMNLLAFQTKQDSSIGNKITTNALALLDQPYVAHTLDDEPVEKLTYHLDKFDCVTFVEYVLAKTLAAKDATDTDNQTLEDYLRQIRYSHGIIDGYGSRLHYFSAWIHNLVSLGYAKDITSTVGGIPYKKTINFMSAHLDKYPKLKNPTTLAAIKQAEASIRDLELYYIPKHTISALAPRIQNGDIVAITTNIQGLDIVHTGFALWQDKELHLLHAASDIGKVMISKEPLAQYLAKHKAQTGIMVVRIQ